MKREVGIQISITSANPIIIGSVKVISIITTFAP